MVTRREPEEVAKRALILGAVAFRSSLEVTDHPRVVDLSGRLLPWLTGMGLQSNLDPIELELLATPFGQLGRSLRIDAKWAGEQAAVFCWMLKLIEEPDELRPVNPENIPTMLGILKPEAAQIIQSAELRGRNEIEAACRQFVLVRSILQEGRLGTPDRQIIRWAHVKQLNRAGVPVTEADIERASKTIGRMTPDERNQAAAFYFARRIAAKWYLNDRGRYFLG
jgi:uncharacterized protein DUF4272